MSNYLNRDRQRLDQIKRAALPLPAEYYFFFVLPSFDYFPFLHTPTARYIYYVCSIAHFSEQLLRHLEE